MARQVVEVVQRCRKACEEEPYHLGLLNNLKIREELN